MLRTTTFKGFGPLQNTKTNFRLIPNLPFPPRRFFADAAKNDGKHDAPKIVIINPETIIPKTEIPRIEVVSKAETKTETNDSYKSAKPNPTLGETNYEYYKKLRKEIGRKAPFGMKGWYLLAGLSLAAAIAYYVNDQDEQNRKVKGVIRGLQSADLETRKIALRALEDCLYEEKNLLSTSADIPYPKEILIQDKIVEALIEAHSDGDEEIKMTTLVWLIRLATSEDGRKRMVRQGIDRIILSIKDFDGRSNLWLMSSALLVELAKYKDTAKFIDTPKVSQLIKELSNSSNPIAKLLGAHLYASIIKHDKAATVSTAIQLNNFNLDLYTNTIAAAAIRSAINSIIPREPASRNPIWDTDTQLGVIGRAGVFGAIAGVYGRYRWWFHARRKGLKGPELTKFIGKSKTGRYVFTILAMDAVAQTLLVWPEEGRTFWFADEPIKLPKFGNAPQTFSIPVAEAIAVTGLSLMAIRWQRYVVLPLFMSSVFAHWDQIDKYTKQVQRTAGVDINVVPNYFLDQTKQATVYVKDIVKNIRSGGIFKGDVKSVQGKANQVKQEVRGKVEEAKGKAVEVKQEAKGKVEEAKGKAGEVKQDVKGKIEEAKGKAGEVKQEVKGKVNEVKQEVKGKVEEIKGKANEVKNDIKGKVEDVKGKANEVKNDIKGKANEVKQEVKGKVEEAKGKATEVKEEVKGKAAEISKELQAKVREETKK